MELIFSCIFLAIYCMHLCSTETPAIKTKVVLPPGVRFTRNELRQITEEYVMETPNLVRKYQYPIEAHNVQTNDGYILQMHRIPYGQKVSERLNKPIVFLQHGLAGSSADWIVTGPKFGLGYILADCGYDVWMGNARGNQYSKKHISLDINDEKFWTFTWHEIGCYDLPAMTDYILNHCEQTQLNYVGYAHGTTAFFVLCSEMPEYNNKFKMMIGMAPIAFMSHSESPFLKSMGTPKDFQYTIKLLGQNKYCPDAKLKIQVDPKRKHDGDWNKHLSNNAHFMTAGFNSVNVNSTLVPIIVGHSQSGTSTKQLIHNLQMMQTGTFGKFDYSIIFNIITYGKLRAPEYNLTRISAPVALIYSRNDWLSTESDVGLLYTRLGNPVGKYLVRDKDFNNADFLWGKNAKDKVYGKIINLLTMFSEP